MVGVVPVPKSVDLQREDKERGKVAWVRVSYVATGRRFRTTGLEVFTVIRSSKMTSWAASSEVLRWDISQALGFRDIDT